MHDFPHPLNQNEPIFYSIPIAAKLISAPDVFDHV